MGGCGKSLSRRDYEALAAFRHALRRFLRFSEEAARQAGLTPQQHQALLAVHGSPDEAVTVGGLAERLQVRHHSAVGLADRLSALGLLRRRTDRADRRRVLLSLTPKGRRLLEGLSVAHRQELARLQQDLSAALGRVPPPAGRGGAPRS